jgi:hypothetical protein
MRFRAVRSDLRRLCETLMVSSTFIGVPQLEHTFLVPSLLRTVRE